VIITIQFLCLDKTQIMAYLGTIQLTPKIMLFRSTFVIIQTLDVALLPTFHRTFLNIFLCSFSNRGCRFQIFWYESL